MLLFFSMYDGKNSMRRVVGLNTKSNRLNSVSRKICDSIEITNNCRIWMHALSLVTSISLRAKYARSGWHWSQNSPQIRVTALQSLLIYWYRLNIGPPSGAPLPLPTPLVWPELFPDEVDLVGVEWGDHGGVVLSVLRHLLATSSLSVCLPVCSAWRLSWTEVGMCYR